MGRFNQNPPVGAIAALLAVAAIAVPTLAEPSQAGLPPHAVPPAAQTPAAQTPAAQTPAAQTPAAQTPAAKTPAAKTPPAQSFASCNSDIAKYCPGVPAGGGRIIRCLAANHDRLTVDCQAGVTKAKAALGL